MALMRSSPSRKDLASDVLDNVHTALDKTKDLLDLAPVPGLSAAADVVLALIEQVKVRISGCDV